MSGLIERFRDRLPFEAGDPVVSIGEGSTPLVRADHVSDLAGREVWLKLEGLNPTGSFKDRGMTCAVSAAVREGAEACVGEDASYVGPQDLSVDEPAVPDDPTDDGDGDGGFGGAGTTGGTDGGGFEPPGYASAFV